MSSGASILRVGDLHKFIQQLGMETLCRVNSEQLARHLVAWLRGPGDKTAWNADVEVLRQYLLERTGFDSAPTNGGEFFDWVQKTLLDFDRLPKDTLANLVDEAATDLAEIEARLEFCREQMAKHAACSNEWDRAQTKFYRHFLAENQAAKDEIARILGRDLKLHAVRGSYASFGFRFDRGGPWSFRWTANSLDPKLYSPVRHAFLPLPVDELHDLVRRYRAGDPSFDASMNDYVAISKPWNAIRAATESHHLLARRANILLPALSAFERGELGLFSSAAAIQIEGIFEDACKLVGVTESELREGTLVNKVQAFQRQADYHPFDHVYYSIWFPLLRNQIAHGRLTEEDPARTANLLLLDLAYACEIVVDVACPSNNLVRLLSELQDGAVDARPDDFLQFKQMDLLRFACLLIDSGGRKPDDFYHLSNVFHVLVEHVESPGFFQTLSKLMERESPYPDPVDWPLGPGLKRLASSLLRILPATKPDCRTLLKSLPEGSEQEVEWADFLSEAARRLEEAQGQ